MHLKKVVLVFDILQGIYTYVEMEKERIRKQWWDWSITQNHKQQTDRRTSLKKQQEKRKSSLFFCFLTL